MPLSTLGVDLQRHLVKAVYQRRRFVRFGLRSLFLITTCFSVVVIAYVSYQAHNVLKVKTLSGAE